MRSLAFLILTILLTSLLTHARAESAYGRVITIRVEGAPAQTRAVELELTSWCRGLQLSRQDDGAWTGSYALLPRMVNGMVRPEVSLLDGYGREIPQTAAVRVALAGSPCTAESLAALMAEKETSLVYDASVAADSIRIVSQSGEVAPVLQRSAFRLPPGLDPAEVASITARTRDGGAIVFVPEWDVDVAETP